MQEMQDETNSMRAISLRPVQERGLVCALLQVERPLSHVFVMKHSVPDPWVPASRENQPRTAISSDLIRDLETRELSTNDYDVLLQLDQGDKRPIQDYLVKVVSGTKVNAEEAKTFGEPGASCSLCAQSLG